MVRKGAACALLACVALAACDNGAKVPSGQVVANVKGEEVTRTQLKSEVEQSQARPTNADGRKQLEQMVLQSIVARKVVAEAARKEGVAKTPEFAMLRDRAEETLLVQAYQQKLLKAVPPVSREDVTRFMNENPDVFGQRKIFVVDQIRVARPADPALLAKFQPLNTMEEVVSLLTAEKLQYQRGTDTLDAVGTQPEIIRQIARLPANEVFVVPTPAGILINQVRETRVVPFSGEPAERYARQVLGNQRQQEVVTRQFDSLMREAKKEVAYAEGYEPAAATKAGGAPKAGAASAAAKGATGAPSSPSAGKQ